MALMNESMTSWHEEVSHAIQTTDGCCTENWNQKHIESEKDSQITKSQFHDFGSILPETQKSYVDTEDIYLSYNAHYKNPLYDKQNLFFGHTLRLLL